MSHIKLIKNKKSFINNLQDDFHISIINQLKYDNKNMRNWKNIFKGFLFISAFVLFRPFYLEGKISYLMIIRKRNILKKV